MYGSPIAVCWNCADEYSPIEGHDPPQDADEPQFCSDECEDAWTAAEDAAEAYEAAGYPSSVFGA